MDMFTILIVEMVSWVYVYVRAYQVACFKYMQFMYVNYTSVKLF